MLDLHLQILNPHFSDVDELIPPVIETTSSRPFAAAAKKFGRLGRERRWVFFKERKPTIRWSMLILIPIWMVCLGLSISTPIWACLPLPGRTPNPRWNLKIVTVVAKLNQFRLYIESGHCYGAWWWINDPFIHSCVLCWFYQQECRRLVSSIWGSVVFACLSWSHLP